MIFTPPTGATANILFSVESTTVTGTATGVRFLRTKTIFTSLKISYFACYDCGQTNDFEVRSLPLAPTTLSTMSTAQTSEVFTGNYI